MERPLRLLVYNHEYDVTRPVTITPSRNWGGQGALGCLLGFGALHRIPAPLEEPPQGPGETLFDLSSGADEKSALAAADASANMTSLPTGGDFLVPANMQFDKAGSPGPPSNTSARTKKHRTYQNASPTKGLDDYFAEGEAKSKEQDFAPAAKAGAVPPPPKAGGPPRGPPTKSPPAAEEATD